MKLQQEEKEFNERYKENWKDIEWVIDNYESGNTTHQDISLVDRVMTDLYRQPYGTEIPFHLMNQNQLAEAGERLKAWYEKTIGNRELRDRIRVSFWLKNGDFKQLPLHQCYDKLLNMFNGSTVFSVDTLTSGFSSGDGLLERYQVYGNLNQSERAKVEHKVQCLVHALRMAGVDEKTCYDIANFTDNRRYNGLSVFADIAENFNLRLRVRIIKPGKEWIDFTNPHNKGWHGYDGPGVKSVELCIFEDHMMVYDEKIPVSLFYIRNMKTINDYADERGWDFERRSKVNCFVKGRPYFNKSKPYTCNTLSLMKTLKESHFIPLKMSDEDVMKNNINPVFAEKDEVHAVPLNNLSTRKITSSSKESVFDETNVFYADFETCKKYEV